MRCKQWVERMHPSEERGARGDTSKPLSSVRRICCCGLCAGQDVWKGHMPLVTHSQESHTASALLQMWSAGGRGGLVQSKPMLSVHVYLSAAADQAIRVGFTIKDFLKLKPTKLQIFLWPLTHKTA